MVEDGKDRIAAVLALEDRAIIGWTVGTLRIKNFEATVPYSTITSTEQTTRAGGAMSKDREVLKIEAERSWTLAFANVFEGGRSVVPYLQGILDGAIKPRFAEQED